MVEIKEQRDMFKANRELRKEMRQESYRNFSLLKSWWITLMDDSQYPLREKMALFWHNHFVVTYQKVKPVYWLYQYNQLLRENAFGNFRELTKQVIRTNAMVSYLDNNKNTIKGYNENLSRELLELFTLGEGNYTEEDIKNGAKGLAGLSFGNDKAGYVKSKGTEEPFLYFGRKGNFKSDEMVDIIFSRKNAPYHITRKILKWFIYDNPPEELVVKYGDFLREQDFEIKPFLTKIFTEEYAKENAGAKIKDPLTFSLHLLDELNIKNQDHLITSFFIKQQGMELFNQSNVKGWEGGNYWLTAQTYLQRNRVADVFCNGRNLSSRPVASAGKNEENTPRIFDVAVNWEKNGSNKEIINSLHNRLLTYNDGSLQEDFESILPYDFKPGAEGASNAILRLFNFMVKAPEFQLI